MAKAWCYGTGSRWTLWPLGPDSVDIRRGDAWQTYRETRQSLLRLRSRRQLLISLRREFPDADELHRSAQKQILLLEQEDQNLLARINDPQAGTGLRFLRPEAPFLGQNPEEMRPQLRPGILPPNGEPGRYGPGASPHLAQHDRRILPAF